MNELVDQQELAERAVRHAAGLNQIIAGYLRMFPELEDDPMIEQVTLFTAEGAPRGAEAVRIVLQDSPSEPFLVSELVQALNQRDWLPESANPANAIRTAVERLVKSEDSDIIKGESNNGSVVYMYAPDRAASRPTYSDEEPF